MSNPKVICVNNPKGGSGKSMISNVTGSLFQAMGKSVILVDADPQKSSLNFSANLPFEVVANDVSTIGTAIEYYKNKYDVVIVDTQGSRDDQLGPRMTAIIAMSDLVIVPIPGSEVDFDGSLPILKALRTYWETHDAPKGVLVMNRFDNNRKLSIAFRDRVALDWPDFTMSKALFPYRQTITNLHQDGRPITGDARVSNVTDVLGGELEGLLYEG